MFAMNKLMLNCSLYQGALLYLPHQTTSAPPPLGRRTATTTTATEVQRTFPCSSTAAATDVTWT